MRLIKGGNTDAARMRIAQLIADGNFGNLGIDETLEMIRDQFRRFSEEKVIPSLTVGMSATSSSRCRSSRRWPNSASSA